MIREPTASFVLMLLLLTSSLVARAVEPAASTDATLGAQVRNAPVTLTQGISAASHAGKPISAKFELEDGKLQLSVYIQKGEKLSELVIDHTTGKVIKSEEISQGDDLVAAKSQREAMAKARTSLKQAVERALKSNKGARATGITPSLKDGKPVVDVLLDVAGEQKSVVEAL